jgi:D-glycero-alpha-D-manno-heptose 1-phosphate guanylyltransferase
MKDSASNNDLSNPPYVKMEAIIVAGGLGTRLRDEIADLPKCMAPIGIRPFLFYVINQLRMQGVTRFIFSLGYKHEYIETYLTSQFSRLEYECVIEEEPLGTGGAIRLALQKATQENVIVANGDTLFEADITKLVSLHTAKDADCTLALKPMQNFDRYGGVSIDDNNIITGFHEKQFYEDGLINGGIYVLNKNRFLAANYPQKFSFEKDFLAKKVTTGNIAGLPQYGYFIDIGIPEDYRKAQTDLHHAPIDLSSIDHTWTLFLDRDGVINVDKPGSYIFNADEFVFMDGLPAAFNRLASIFGQLVVVTNQRGVGRGLMTEQDLHDIHQKMLKGVEGAGGKIDAVYYCTAVDNCHAYRKPNPGMAVRAKADLPAIDFRRSIMVGNNITDMQWGRNAGTYTVFLKTTIPDMEVSHPDIDLIFDSLADFAKAL